MKIIGIDPGKKGALVAVDEKLNLLGCLLISDCQSPRDFLNFTKNADLIVLEHAQPYTGEGVKSCFTYGEGFGWLLCAIEFAKYLQGDIETRLVPPAGWYAYFRKAMPTALRKKQASYYWAKHVWPSETFLIGKCKKPHLGVVDAAMLALYGVFAVRGISPNLLYERARRVSPVITCG